MGDTFTMTPTISKIAYKIPAVQYIHIQQTTFKSLHPAPPHTNILHDVVVLPKFISFSHPANTSDNVNPKHKLPPLGQ